MGDVGFGKDFNNLVSGVEHPAIKGVHSHMTMLGIMSTVPWLLNILGSIPGAAAGYSDFFSFCAGQIREKHKVSCSHWLNPGKEAAKTSFADVGSRAVSTRRYFLVTEGREGTRCFRLTKRSGT